MHVHCVSDRHCLCACGLCRGTMDGVQRGAKRTGQIKSAIGRRRFKLIDPRRSRRVLQSIVPSLPVPDWRSLNCLRNFRCIIVSPETCRMNNADNFDSVCSYYGMIIIRIRIIVAIEGQEEQQMPQSRTEKVRTTYGTTERTAQGTTQATAHRTGKQF